MHLQKALWSKHAKALHGFMDSDSKNWQMIAAGNENLKQSNSAISMGKGRKIELIHGWILLNLITWEPGRCWTMLDLGLSSFCVFRNAPKPPEAVETYWTLSKHQVPARHTCMIPDATELVSIWRMSATWSQHYKGVTCKMSKVFKSTDGFSARKNMSEKYVEYFAYKVHIYI